MTAKPPSYEELTRLIAALLEGQLSERERLDTLLRASPEARRLYLQMIDQEVELSCVLVPGGARDSKILPLGTTEETCGGAPPHPSFGHLLPRGGEGEERTMSPARTRRRWRAAAAAAAAVLILIGAAALAWYWSRTLPGTRPLAEDIPAPATWSEDFERGLLGGWSGVLVATNLPPGSQYGISGVLREFPGGSAVHQIQLPEDWNRGLFTLSTGATLHVTYRLGTRGHVHVLMHTIPSDPGVNGYQMYQFGGAAFSGRIGRWQTASIPFAQFHRKIVVPTGTREFAGGPPQDGERVTTLSFSSVDPIDFVIDRVWVMPSGPSR